MFVSFPPPLLSESMIRGRHLVLPNMHVLLEQKSHLFHRKPIRTQQSPPVTVTSVALVESKATDVPPFIMQQSSLSQDTLNDSVIVQANMVDAVVSDIPRCSIDDCADVPPFIMQPQSLPQDSPNDVLAVQANMAESDIPHPSIDCLLIETDSLEKKRVTQFIEMKPIEAVLDDAEPSTHPTNSTAQRGTIQITPVEEIQRSDGEITDEEQEENTVAKKSKKKARRSRKRKATASAKENTLDTLAMDSTVSPQPAKKLKTKTTPKKSNTKTTPPKKSSPPQRRRSKRLSSQKADKPKMEDERKPLVCKFFKSGSCHNAPCAFSHDLKMEACVFWHLKGGCLKGQDCPFSHDPMTEQQKFALELDEQKWQVKLARAASTPSAKSTPSSPQSIPQDTPAASENLQDLINSTLECLETPSTDPTSHSHESHLPPLSIPTLALQFSL